MKLNLKGRKEQLHGITMRLYHIIMKFYYNLCFWFYGIRSWSNGLEAPQLVKKKWIKGISIISIKYYRNTIRDIELKVLPSIREKLIYFTDVLPLFTFEGGWFWNWK